MNRQKILRTQRSTAILGCTIFHGSSQLLYFASTCLCYVARFYQFVNIILEKNKYYVNVFVRLRMLQSTSMNGYESVQCICLIEVLVKIQIGGSHRDSFVF